MAEPQHHDGPSDFSGGTSDSTLQLNIKTLDSRIYSFNVDKNIPISAFKEKIASQSGVPVGQQRLIFRGKVLKDDHLLSGYNVENGDTLHLVERQPQSTSGSSTGEATSSNGNRGNDTNAGGPRNRIGPIAHSIVLGTLNVGDPGEAVMPDLSRVIGAVLNSIGINNQTGGMQPGAPLSQGNEPEGLQANAGSQSQDGNRSVPLQAFSGQMNAMQNPIGPFIAAPSLNMPIPDSLNTLLEFINRMERVFSQNGNQSNASSDLPTVDLPSDPRGLPTVEALSIVLQHAQRLLSDHAAPALSHIAGRLDQQSGSHDPAVRGQVQTESVHLGMAIQHLGALLLELGRTILTLRMGQSPAGSSVNAGPAVYISPSGPNPIMAQPFPLQTSSLFGGSSSVSPNPVSMGSIGVSSVPRNVNIHIHAGTSLAPLVATMGTRASPREGVQGEPVNTTESGDSGQAGRLLGINVTATADPSQRDVVSVSAAGPPGTSVPQSPDPNSVSSEVAELNALTRRQNRAPAGQAAISTNQELHGSGDRDDDIGRHNIGAGRANDTLSHVTMVGDQKCQDQAADHHDFMGADVSHSSSESSKSSQEGSQKISSTSNLTNDYRDNSSGVPLGLGLGGLQPKKRSGPKAPNRAGDGDGDGASNQNQQLRAVGQQVLQSLASLSTRETANSEPSSQSQNSTRAVEQRVPTARQTTEGSSDVADAMSEMLRSPALDGLLDGVSQQTGIGSPDMLRSMLQQFTQNPSMRNTVNQIAQQVDSHDLGSMFSGMDRRPGGGIDLSRMMQQMMPIVSQALGGLSSVSDPSRPSEPMLSGNMSRRDASEINNRPQPADLQQVVQMLQNHSSSEEIFHSFVDRVANLSFDGASRESTINELCTRGHLAQDFMEMLRHDISKRLEDETGS